MRCRQSGLDRHLLGVLSKERRDGSGQRARQAIDKSGANEREPAARRLPDRRRDLTRFRQQPGRALTHNLAGWRQRDRTHAAIEELNARSRFEIGDGLRDRGLREREFLGGGRHRPCFAYGQKSFERVQVEREPVLASCHGLHIIRMTYIKVNSLLMYKAYRWYYDVPMPSATGT